MEETRRCDCDGHIYDGHARVQDLVDLGEETCLARSASDCQGGTKAVELSLVAQWQIHAGQESTGTSYGCVETSVCPTADGIDGRVFPCLKAIVVVEVMRRLPEVEYFVTVLDRTEEGCNDMAHEKGIEGNDWGELEWSFFGPEIGLLANRWRCERRTYALRIT